MRYYHTSRTQLALEKEAPKPRAVEPPEHGRIVALPQVGGLHHRYTLRADVVARSASSVGQAKD